MTKRILLAFFFLLCLNSIGIQDTFTQSELNFYKELTCLSENIYYESRGESNDGRAAVAQVTINRTKDSHFPSNVCEVVYQKTGKTPQFSWTTEHHNQVKDMESWYECVEIARKALTEEHIHPLLAESKALYYKAYYSKANWHKKYIVATIGNHTFYTSI